MLTTEKKKLQKQLEDTARMLGQKEGEELILSLVSVANAFLKLSSASMDAGKASEEMEAAYMAMAEKVKAFFVIRANAYSCGMSQKIEELQKLKDEAASRGSENQRVSEELEAWRKNVAEAEAIAASHQKELQEYTPEILSGWEKKNADLAREIEEKKKVLQPLQEENTRLVQEKQKVVEETEVVKASLESIPENLKKLQEDYHALEERLGELMRAEVCCSADWQKALLDLISSSMDDLRSVLTDHENFLNQTEETAIKLAESLESCRTKREEFSHWLDADKTPLEKMMDALGQPGNKQLSETLDFRKVAEVKKLLEETQKDLERLDDILSSCSIAVKEDVEKIRQAARYGSKG
ncbi:MAG: hypothetical protein K5697_08905 [Lachnospiraceae bacterium]|nr:hypothetical protein [Lachnospiraceae bacterium]